MRLFDEDTLMMLFEELGLDFEDWAAQYNYASMSDQEIYNVLPQAIINELSEFGINASWMHDGM